MPGNDPSSAGSGSGQRPASARKRGSKPPFDRERFIFKLLAVVIITQLSLYIVATGVCGNVAYSQRQKVVEVCPRVLDQVTSAFDATLKLLIALLGGAALNQNGR